jgi:alkylation response protein AidB-like acyl-CoA dehydrogenase
MSVSTTAGADAADPTGEADAGVPVGTTTAAERDDLRAAVRDLLADASPIERVAEIVDADLDYDPAVWSALSSDLGVTSLALPSAYGGDGYGYVELQVVCEELGRALLPSAFFATVVLAGAALQASRDTEACTAYLPGIASGELTATVAVGEGDGGWHTDRLTTRATADGEHWRLRGTKPLVVDGATAGLLLVVAATPQGPSLFAVTGDEGVTRTPLRVLDGTRRIARVDLDAAPATLVGAIGDGARIVGRVVELGTTALAAEQVGGARACSESSAAYARDRVQFGRPIGSFQAVKHKCADMLTRVSLADAAATEAAEAASGVAEAADLATASAVAHATCSDAYMDVARETIQVHGGIAFTWEHPAHRYFRRAKASQLLFGGPAEYLERLLHAVGV